MISFTNISGAEEIGANCYLLEMDGTRVVLDSGMHPKREGLAAMPQFDVLEPNSVEAVFLSHSHLDRLSDSWNAKPCNEGFRVGFRQNLLATFYDAGHILGSAGVMLESESGHTVFYTGDVQFENQSMIPGADFPESGVDTLIMECTRGGFQRSAHYSRPEEMVRFGQAIADTLERGGAVLIPVFAIGKSQEMLFNIHRFKQQGVIPANTPVYFGGLSAKVSLLYDRFSGLTRRHDHDFKLKEEIQTVPLPRKGKAPLVCTPGNIYVVSSGMMTEKTLSNVMAEQVLPHEKNAILFVGYADPDSPAGQLKTTPHGELVKMRPNGQPVRRKCTIDCFDFSGHATRDSLVDYAVKLKPKQVILVHGDPDAVEWMHDTLAFRMPDAEIIAPVPGKRYTFDS